MTNVMTVACPDVYAASRIIAGCEYLYEPGRSETTGRVGTGCSDRDEQLGARRADCPLAGHSKTMADCLSTNSHYGV